MTYYLWIRRHLYSGGWHHNAMRYAFSLKDGLSRPNLLYLRKSGLLRDI